MNYKRPDNPHVVCPECDTLVHPMDLCCGQCVTNEVAQEVATLTDKLNAAETQLARYKKSIALTDANTRRMQRVIVVARDIAKRGERLVTVRHMEALCEAIAAADDRVKKD